MYVRWLRSALRELGDEAEYIAKDNPRAATKVVTAITNAVERLRRFPAMGRPGRVPGTRELVVPNMPYIVPYRVRNNEIEVLRIFHAARKWPKSLDLDDCDE